MKKVQDLKGTKFGDLTVIERRGSNKHGSSMWLCHCECGNLHTVSRNHLISGKVESCGCKRRKRKNTMGMSNTRLYHVWAGMKQRCYGVNNKDYANYGGKGIGLCEEWKNSFYSFYLWAIANGYDENAPTGQCTIERIDVNGNYCPENCKWITSEEQNRNQRKTMKITYNGKTQTLGQWAKETGINYQTIRNRIIVQHLSPEQALSIKSK